MLVYPLFLWLRHRIRKAGGLWRWLNPPKVTGSAAYSVETIRHQQDLELLQQRGWIG